ncbi:MAG: pantetheine-phosphate adenylyltransferase [Oscillospiraceae bacterium]|nr:pantetheine-phosphate adenylyltransferase [Oscillospiraceae bacterium]
MKIAVYPGSFDPITNGHLDILKRASQIFDKIYITVLENSAKVSSALFTVSERVEMIKLAAHGLDNVEVCSFSGLLVNFAEEVGARYIVKGIRAVSDFDYEFQMAVTNRDLSDKVETLLLPAGKKYMFLSSSIVKEVGRLGGELSEFVPEQIIDTVKEKLKGA